MSAAQIVLLLLGIILFIVSFLVSEKKEVLDAGLKEQASEEVKRLVKEEVDSVKSGLQDSSEEAVSHAVEKTERALERVTNEKVMAISEYAETVVRDIHKNHTEVLFMYDMLNEKEEDIKQMVTDAEEERKKIGERIENAEEKGKRIGQQIESTEEKWKRTGEQIEDAEEKWRKAEERIEGAEEKCKKIGERIEGAEKAVQELEDKVAAIARPAEKPTAPKRVAAERKRRKPAEKQAVERPAAVKGFETFTMEELAARGTKVVGAKADADAEDTEVQDVEAVALEENSADGDSGSFEASGITGEGISGGGSSGDNHLNEMSGNPGMGQGSAPIPGSSVVSGVDMPLTDSRAGGAPNNNERILAMHRDGKSNVAIAKELGLGIGEVKIVIDLFEGTR